MCGAPTLAASLGDGDDALDWEHSCPVGADEFVERWLEGVTGKVDQVMQAIVTLPGLATGGRPSVQVANLLLQQCVVQKAIH
eukprot:12402622-Karenia_brevis.AAC.1